MWEGEVLKAFLLRHRLDIVSITFACYLDAVPRLLRLPVTSQTL